MAPIRLRRAKTRPPGGGGIAGRTPGTVGMYTQSCEMPLKEPRGSGGGPQGWRAVGTPGNPGKGVGSQDMGQVPGGPPGLGHCLQQKGMGDVSHHSPIPIPGSVLLRALCSQPRISLQLFLPCALQIPASSRRGRKASQGLAATGGCWGQAGAPDKHPNGPKHPPRAGGSSPCPKAFCVHCALPSIQPPVNEPQHERSNQPRRSPASSNLPPSLLCRNFPGCGFLPLIPHSFIHQRSPTGGTGTTPK